MATIFIAGIDTDSGKTIVTGCIAKYLLEKGESVITQKFAQTGCVKFSDDIKTHRSLMGMELLPVDKDGLTCPYIFSFPASPHLSAEREGKAIDVSKIRTATQTLEKEYSTVLLEGVGGLLVPINRQATVLDYIEEQGYPIILVSTPKLGSINHTLLSLEVLKQRGIELKGIVYNKYPNTSPEITEDSKVVMQNFLKEYFPNAGFVEIPQLLDGECKGIDFGPLFH